MEYHFLKPSIIESALHRNFSTLFDIDQVISLETKEVAIKWIRCALTEYGPMLLIEINSSASPLAEDTPVHKYNNYSNIRIEVSEKNIGGKSDQFICISCKDSDLYHLFLKLCADIIWKLNYDLDETITPYRAILSWIENWSQFFSYYDDKYEEKKLVGELLTLEALIGVHNRSVTSWVKKSGSGPCFFSDNVSISVAVTSMKTGYFVEKHGLDNAELSQDIKYLHFVRAVETDKGDIVPDVMIKHLAEQFSSEEKEYFYKQLGCFSDKVIKSRNRWKILESVFFRADENFPELKLDHFINHQLPSGVVRIGWTADLSSLDQIDINLIEF